MIAPPDRCDRLGDVGTCVSTTVIAIHDMVNPHSRSTVIKGDSLWHRRPHPSARLDHAVTCGCSTEAPTPNDTSRVTLRKPQGRRLFERTNAQAASNTRERAGRRGWCSSAVISLSDWCASRASWSRMPAISHCPALCPDRVRQHGRTLGGLVQPTMASISTAVAVETAPTRGARGSLQHDQRQRHRQDPVAEEAQEMRTQAGDGDRRHCSTRRCAAAARSSRS